jgi:hypothetical protein
MCICSEDGLPTPIVSVADDTYKVMDPVPALTLPDEPWRETSPAVILKSWFEVKNDFELRTDSTPVPALRTVASDFDTT